MLRCDTFLDTAVLISTPKLGVRLDLAPRGLVHPDIPRNHTSSRGRVREVFVGTMKACASFAHACDTAEPSLCNERALMVVEGAGMVAEMTVDVFVAKG